MYTDVDKMSDKISDNMGSPASRNADIERCLDKILDSDISDIPGYRLTDE